MLTATAQLDIVLFLLLSLPISPRLPTGALPSIVTFLLPFFHPAPLSLRGSHCVWIADHQCLRGSHCVCILPLMHPKYRFSPFLDKLHPTVTSPLNHNSSLTVRADIISAQVLYVHCVVACLIGFHGSALRALSLSALAYRRPC